MRWLGASPAVNLCAPKARRFVCRLFLFLLNLIQELILCLQRYEVCLLDAKNAILTSISEKKEHQR